MCCWMKNQALDYSLPLKKKKKHPYLYLHISALLLCAGGINRAGAAVPTFLRTPTMIQPHLDMKPFLQFPMETAPPPPHSMSLFHNFNTVSATQRKSSSLHTHTGTLASGNKTKTCDALMFLYFLNCLRKPDIPHCTLSA